MSRARLDVEALGLNPRKPHTLATIEAAKKKSKEKTVPVAPPKSPEATLVDGVKTKAVKADEPKVEETPEVVAAPVAHVEPPVVDQQETLKFEEPAPASEKPKHVEEDVATVELSQGGSKKKNKKG